MNLIEKITADGDNTRWQSQVISSFNFGAAQHQTLEKNVHLLEGFPSFPLCTESLNGFQEFRVEPARMIHRLVTTGITMSFIGKSPVSFLTFALFAEIVGKRIRFKESQQ
jgi:hypothetical protein